MIAMASMLLIAYGWEMHFKAPLAIILITLFLLSNLVTGAQIANTALVTDLNHLHVASAAAAMNLTRCLLSAGGVACITPLIDAVGIGWTAMLASLIWVLTGIAFLVVYLEGFKWRSQRSTASQVDS